MTEEVTEDQYKKAEEQITGVGAQIRPFVGKIHAIGEMFVKRYPPTTPEEVIDAVTVPVPLRIFLPMVNAARIVLMQAEAIVEDQAPGKADAPAGGVE